MKILWTLAELALTPLLWALKGLVLGAALLPAAALVRRAFDLGWAAGVVSIGLAYLVFGLALMSLVVAIKWVSLYRARPGDHPYISARVAHWAVLEQLYDLAQVLFVRQVRGTWLMNAYLRALGARIGRDAVINTTSLSDWDLITIGAGTMVGDGAVILGHSGEKGRLVQAPVRIGAGCTIGRDTVVFPGAVLEDGAVLGALSVVPKNKVLPAGSAWVGTDLHRIA